MEVQTVIKESQERRGISTAELSRRTGIEYEALRTSLRGERGITAGEFVSLCRELGLNLADFEKKSDSEKENE